MATLLEISEDLLALNDLIEGDVDATGEISPEAAAALDQWFAELTQDRDRKLDNYGALVRERTLRAAARREEMERLAIRVRVDENQVKYLKQRLMEFLIVQKTPKVETRRYKFSCCGNGGVQPMDVPERPEDLPKDYQKQVVAADTEKIRADLAAGKTVAGCCLRERGKHLRIT